MEECIPLMHETLVSLAGGLMHQPLRTIVRPPDAAVAGAYLHGLAGRLAAEENGGGLVAPDVVAQLSNAIAAVRSGEPA